MAAVHSSIAPSFFFTLNIYYTTDKRLQYCTVPLFQEIYWTGTLANLEFDWWWVDSSSETRFWYLSYMERQKNIDATISTAKSPRTSLVFDETILSLQSQRGKAMALWKTWPQKPYKVNICKERCKMQQQDIKKLHCWYPCLTPSGLKLARK